MAHARLAAHAALVLVLLVAATAAAVMPGVIPRPLIAAVTWPPSTGSWWRRW